MTNRYSNIADKSMQIPVGGQGLAYTRMCDKCRRPAGTLGSKRHGPMWHCKSCVEAARAVQPA